MEAPVITTAEESPSCWKSPSSCIIDIAEFLEKAKSCKKKDELLFLEDVQELKIVTVR